MKNIELFSENNINNLDYFQLGEIYLKIFSHIMWFEGVYNEKLKFSIDSKATIIRTLDEQSLIIKNELCKKGVLFQSIGDKKNNVMGISYGWSDNIENINREIWDFDQNTLQKIKNNIKNITGNNNFNEKLFYHMAFGILSEYRGKGFGKKLFKSFINEVSKNNDYLLTKVQKDSKYYKILQKNKGKIVYEIDENNILAILFLKNKIFNFLYK